MQQLYMQKSSQENICEPVIELICLPALYDGIAMDISRKISLQKVSHVVEISRMLMKAISDDTVLDICIFKSPRAERFGVTVSCFI